MSKLDEKIAELHKKKIEIHEELSRAIRSGTTNARDVGKLNRLMLISGHIGELSALAHLANWQRVEDLLDE
jgi:hypothetical protein